MHIPWMGSERKARWVVLAYEKELQLLIEHLNKESHLETLHNQMSHVYQKLQKWQIQMPDIEPRAIGHAEFDETWVSFHSKFLQALLDHIKFDAFDLRKWNFRVKGKNGKRRMRREQIINEPGFTATGNATPISWLFTVSQATGNTIPSPWHKRIRNWLRRLRR